ARRRTQGAVDRAGRGHDGTGGAMTLAFRELRRRPGRFALATVILTLIAVLLLFLGGLLDGLLAGSTGAYRAQRADLIVYSANASESLVRSRLTADDRAQVEEVD